MTVIPARGNKGREALDSVFLLRYAKRLEARAQWMVAGHGLWGALVGFGLGSAIVAVRGFYQMFAGQGLNLAVLMGQAPAPAAEAWIWVYLPWMAALSGMLVWGLRGHDKQDELRFQAQMALHVLRLQELALMDNERA